MFFGYVLVTPRWGDSNKYPQHMFLGVNKGEKVFYHLSYGDMLEFFITANSFKQQNLEGQMLSLKRGSSVSLKCDNLFLSSTDFVNE